MLFIWHWVSPGGSDIKQLDLIKHTKKLMIFWVRYQEAGKGLFLLENANICSIHFGGNVPFSFALTASLRWHYKPILRLVWFGPMFLCFICKYIYYICTHTNAALSPCGRIWMKPCQNQTTACPQTSVSQRITHTVKVASRLPFPHDLPFLFAPFFSSCTCFHPLSSVSFSPPTPSSAEWETVGIESRWCGCHSCIYEPFAAE